MRFILLLRNTTNENNIIIAKMDPRKIARFLILTFNRSLILRNISLKNSFKPKSTTMPDIENAIIEIRFSLPEQNAGLITISTIPPGKTSNASQKIRNRIELIIFTF